MRYRLWVEVFISILSCILLVVILISDKWIEYVFGVEPDRGDGSLEWAIAAVMAASAAIFSVLARREFRRSAEAFDS